jgi:C-terminal processing protease CtpA/Prc
MKYLSKLFKVILLTTLSFILGGQSLANNTQIESTPYNVVYKKELLLEDFDQLIKMFIVKHPKMFTNMDEFESMRVLQRAKITDMNEYEFFQILAPVIEKMNCGHTSIKYSKLQQKDIVDNGNFLPFDVKIIDEELYLINDFSSQSIKKGAKITSIDGKAAGDIIDEVYKLYTSDGDNLSAKQAQINSGFNPHLSFAMAYQTIIGSPENFNVSYLSPNNKSISTANVSASKYRPKTWKNESLSFDYKDNYATLTVPHFYTYSSSELKKFSHSLDKFFRGLKARSIDNLILDLRGNSGGDPNAGNILLSYLLTSPFQYFDSGNIKYFYEPLTQQSQLNEHAFNGKLITLIDGLIFSTTGHVLSHLANQKRGKFIGQESGGGYICNDGSEMINLDNTKVGFNVATFAFSTSVQGQTRGQGIRPDIEAKYRIQDYLNNTDLEMQAALDLIQ